jgi:hypothetical protein
VIELGLLMNFCSGCGSELGAATGHVVTLSEHAHPHTSQPWHLLHKATSSPHVAGALSTGWGSVLAVHVHPHSVQALQRWHNALRSPHT